MSKMHFSLFSVNRSFKCFTHFSIELSVFLVICMSLRMHFKYFWHLSSDFSHSIVVCVCVQFFFLLHGLWIFVIERDSLLPNIEIFFHPYLF